MPECFFSTVFLQRGQVLNERFNVFPTQLQYTELLPGMWMCSELELPNARLTFGAH